MPMIKKFYRYFILVHSAIIELSISANVFDKMPENVENEKHLYGNFVYDLAEQINIFDICKSNVNK